MKTEIDYSFWRTLAYDLKYPYCQALSASRWKKLPLRVRIILNALLKATAKPPVHIPAKWDSFQGCWVEFQALEDDLNISSEITDPPMYPSHASDPWESENPDNSAYWTA